MLTFNHFNFNVTDLDRSLAFYKEALGLEPVRRKEAEDGSFVLVFLGDGKTDFRLELTWLRDHPQKYDLGECEFHLALTAEDFAAARGLRFAAPVTSIILMAMCQPENTYYVLFRFVVEPEDAPAHPPFYAPPTFL